MAGYPHGSGAGGRGPRRRNPWWRRVRWMRLFLFLVFLFGISGTMLAAGFMVGAVRAMGPITALRPQVAQTSFIYDRHGELLTEIQGPENRIVVPLERIPEHVRNAFIAIEDERFYEHFGVDPIGIARAVINNLRGGHLQGASTITQQLARSAFLTQERTWRRKIQEAILAIELERRFTKDEILEMYLNQIYFGNGAYGIQAASYTYFGKPVEELTIAEAAVLAGIPKNPSAYPPPPIPDPGEEPSKEDRERAEHGRWKERQRLVLAKMRQLGYITEEQYQAALEEDVLANRPKVNTQSPRPDQDVFGHVVDYIIEETERVLAEQLRATHGLDAAAAQARARELLYQGGLRIYSTVDPELQRAAYRAQQEHLRALGYPMPTPDDPNRGPQAAAVLIDVENAQIVAMVGGRSYEKPLGGRDWNFAEDSRRGLGSATKPLTAYGPALAAGYTPATAVDDVAVAVPSGGGTHVIANFEPRYFGYTPFRFGLKRSINTVAVRAVQLVGVDQAWEFGRRLGLPLVDRDRDVAPLALGSFTEGVSPLQVADAYATLARGGVREPAYIVAEIRDAQGRVLYRHQSQKEAVVDERVAYLLADMMREVMEPHRFPTDSRLYRPSTGTGYSVHNNYFRRPAAGKTGTNDDRDVWFVGFTPQYAAAVWVGYAVPDKETGRLPANASGARVPGPIWGRIMAAAHQGKPVRWFDPPDGIVTATVCANTGLLPGPHCPEDMRYREVFAAGTQPTQAEDLWVTLPVCAENPELVYAPGCACTPTEKAFFNRPRAEVPTGYPQPRDYALRPPDPTKASCTTAPAFQRDRAPNEIWLTPEGPVPGELAVTGEPGGTATIRITDVAGRDHRVTVPLPDRQIQVAASQSVEVPLTLPAEPGDHEFRVTATSAAPDGGTTTMVVRLRVTVRGAEAEPGGEQGEPGAGDDEGGRGRGPGGGGGGVAATVTVRLAGPATQLLAPGGPLRVTAGQAVQLVIADGLGQPHEGVRVSINGRPAPGGGGRIDVPAGQQVTLTLTFRQPGRYQVEIDHDDHQESARVVVEAVPAQGEGDDGGDGDDEAAGGQAVLPLGPGAWRVDWDRWWAGLTRRAA
ncbi:PBP1A family penicillin-binding protein [Thermaerobacter composti]|uniref:Penicillin-binding protein 1A n=1 Tax=Thermaerobacter composti TaxID=554949 RepID=A0ABZ0QTL1_9FIRM|nr:PBP1A family penicillin-binding protein [Thermaerobacter composti]WPD19848.1 PBP1A family penicillin-binding protein [Thermaerobacter composti]